MKHSLHRSLRLSRSRRQQGLTLIELMVALAIGMVVAIASVAALIAARSGYSAVDANSQLRENGRFAADMIQRIVAQGGYDDQVLNKSTKRCGTFSSSCSSREPDITGYNDALFSATTFPPSVTNGSRTTGCGAFGDTTCRNGSDVLVVRYQGSSMPNSTVADGSMINCAGVAEAAPTDTSTAESRAYAVFHVARSDSGEPTLMCSYRDSSGNWARQALVHGIETFQVLYGVDYGTSSVVSGAAATGTQDSVADRYLRADQLLVAGDVEATRANWRRVRTLRIGMVIRSSVGTASIDRSFTRNYFPLSEREAPTLATDDPGMRLTVAADGRIRQEVSFTVALRNRQELN